MSEWIEMLQDINSIEDIGLGLLILISFAIINAVAQYIQLLYASWFEAIFMSKNEESKRFFFMYAVLFFFLGIKNYILTMDASLFILSSGILVIASIVSFILWGLNKFGKAKSLYGRFKEELSLITFITSIVFFVYVASRN